MSREAWRTPPVVDRPSVEARHAAQQVQELCVQLFHLAPVGYLIHDPRGLIQDANHTAASMLGVSSHELRGERLHEFVCRDDAARLSAHESHVVLSGERCTLHVRMERPGGTRFSAMLESVSLGPPGPDTRVLTTLFDETERVRSDAQLLEREATLRAVLGAARNAFIGVDEHGSIRAFEGASERIFGHRRADVIGKYVGILFDVAAPPAVPRWPSEEPPRARIRRRDGTTLEAEVTVHRVAGASYTVVCVRDVSREEELTRALTEAQRLEIAGRLAAGVAHDTNNLLVRILSAADALLEDADPHALREHAAELRRAAEGGAAIVRRLAALLGPELRGPSDVELDRAIESLRVVLEPMTSNVALIVSLEASDRRVRCHFGQIEQIVLNLVMNALDAMPDGGTIELSTKRLERSGRVAIEVRDSGVGMSEEVRARIFEPAFTTKKTGTGLGLTTVASIVRGAGGSIEVESAIGAGTTFRIELPAVSVRPVVSPRSRATPPPSTLLLFTHDTLLRSTLRAHLERSRHRVLEASDVHDAIERCRTYRGPIHALLLEGVPGDGPGAELAERARALHPEAPVLFLSSRPRADLVAGRVASDVFLVQLPCSEEELSSALARALEGRWHPRRVLFVEDDALFRRVFGQLLSREGYDVVLASTIAEAMARHREGPADVIVADGKLPDGGVGDLLRELRGAGDERPVVVLSGLGPGEDRAIAAALQIPNTTFLQKPADVDQLIAAFDAFQTAR